MVELADRDILHRKDQRHSSREEAYHEAQRRSAELASPLISPQWPDRPERAEGKAFPQRRGLCSADHQPLELGQGTVL